MINILRKNFLKKKKFGFCLLKDLEENFSNEKNDPYKQFLFDFEYTQKKLKETEMFMLPVEYKKNILKQKLKENGAQDLYLKYKPRTTQKILGLKNDIYNLDNKINNEENDNSFYDRFDFKIEINQEISQLNKYKNYEIKQQSNKYLDNQINDELDYIQIGLDFQEVLQRFKKEQNLKENEIIVYNFPITWKPVQCINLLNQKIEDIQQAKIKLNELGQVSYVQLKMKDQEQIHKVQKLNDLDLERSTLKTYVQNQEELNYNQRLVVIENLQDDVDEEYLYLTASQYGKVDKVFFMKELQLGQISNTSNFVQYMHENSKLYEDYYNVSVNEIQMDKQKEITLYEKKSKFEKYQEILNKNMDKNRDINQELKVMSEQEMEDQKQRIIQYFNKKKVTTIQDYIEDNNIKKEHKQSQILLKKNNFNNFGVQEKSLKTALICFSSKQDAQKGIYGIKFIEKLSKQIKLFNNTHLYEYIPQFKYKVYLDALKKHENFSQDQTQNQDNIESQKLDKNLKQQLYENWKDVLPDEISRKVFAQESYQENNVFDDKNLFVKQSFDVNKINQKLELKQKLKIFLDNYAQVNLYSNDDNFNDSLGSLQENKKVNKQKGRDFGTNQLRQATLIMKERLRYREQKNFQFFQSLLQQFNDITTNDILTELQSISYEEGIKEQLINQFYYFKERLASIENQNQDMNQKKLRSNQKLKSILQSPKFMFSLYTNQQKDYNQKLYEKFFQKQLSIVNALKENKKSNLKSQFDKFADVLHIEDIKGERFFSEQDIKEAEHQIYGQELTKFKNWEKNEKNFIYQTQTPENIVSSYFDKDLDLANQYFDGLTTKLYHYKQNQNDLNCSQLVQKLNQNKENKQYDFFKQNDNQYYIIEKVKLFDKNIPKIFECLQQLYQNITIKVCTQNNITQEHLVNCIYKEIKNDQESKSIKDLIDLNNIQNQQQHLIDNGFTQEQIEGYYNLTEQQLHKSLQYFYEIQEQNKQLEEQNIEIENLKQATEDAQEDIDKQTKQRQRFKQTEATILRQVQFDLERQKRLFQKKINAYTRQKERELLNEGIEKNLKGEVVEEVGYSKEEIEVQNQLFSKEMEELFERVDDDDIETSTTDGAFDILEGSKKQSDLEGQEEEQQDNIDPSQISKPHQLKKKYKIEEVSKKLGSKKMVLNVETEILQDRVTIEKELDKFKND